MKLKDLIKGMDCKVRGCGDVSIDSLVIRGITADSREIPKGAGNAKEGFIFVALKGEHADGHDFAAKAVQNGASAVVAERDTGARAPHIIVEDTRAVLASLCRNFYGEPSKALNLIGVTGTNGKTTTACLIESILRAGGIETGLIGTVNYRFGSRTLAAPYTTPEPTVLYRVLGEMRDAGVSHCVMEVSSHALALGRIDGLRFTTAVFTNLTQDHLDFHGTMEHYFRSKAGLFKGPARGAAAVINLDDPWGRRLAGEVDGRVLGYSTGSGTGAKIFPLRYSLFEDGMEALVSTPQGEVAVKSSLVGDYNLQNVLAAIGAATALGIDTVTIAKGIASLKSVAGRLERVEPEGASAGFSAYVDYAHTPDALERVLRTLRPITKRRLITVFGCGGNRDRTKRPLMGRAAVELSDITILTSDNPRDEDPVEIIRDIEDGLEGTKKVEAGGEPVQGSFMVIPDRAEAIREAVRIAGAGDTILVAGKGHEDYQIVKGVKHHFSDLEVLRSAMGGLKAAVGSKGTF